LKTAAKVHGWQAVETFANESTSDLDATDRIA
jgi:hypothetical protein